MIKSILTILIFLSPYGLCAQTFRTAAVLGINMSQIDGDNLAGYHKIGLNTGLKSYAMLSEKFSLSFEMLFSQKGARSTTFFTPNHPVRLTLNYVEIPVEINFHDRESAIFSAGLAYARLLSYKRIEAGANTTNDTFPVNKKDWLILGDI